VATFEIDAGLMAAGNRPPQFTASDRFQRLVHSRMGAFVCRSFQRLFRHRTVAPRTVGRRQTNVSRAPILNWRGTSKQ
jgi:hypothetical protein